MEYQNARLICYDAETGDYLVSDVTDQVGVTICAFGPDYELPTVGTEDFDNANVLPRPDAIENPNDGGPSEQYPNLCPTRRRLTPAEYPTRRYTAINGAGRTRLYGSKAYDATLELEYLLDDQEMAQLLESWHNSRGGYVPLALDPEVFAGISPTLLAQIPNYLSWRWAQTPVVESLLPNRSRVTVNLIATLDD